MPFFIATTMKKILLLLALSVLWGCATTQLVEEWKNPDTVTYTPKKILVIGMTSNSDVRRNFETTLVSTLEREGIVAVRSIDFFESRFHSDPMKQNDLDDVEHELLARAFDVVLITQLMGTEEKVTFLKTHREPLLHSNFKEYYFHHQDIFKTSEKSSYTVYHTHTSFYCLCPGNERELIWSGGIDLSGPGQEKPIITSFTKKLVRAMKKQSILEKS